MSKKRKQERTKPVSRVAKPDISVTGGVSDPVIALLLALFGFVLYANTLGHGYVLDDDLTISLHANVQRGLSGIADIFSQPYRENCFGGCLYRPLTLSCFAVEWAIAPNSPFIGHLMNVAWYSATAALFYITLRKLMPYSNSIMLCAVVVLFTAHPIHTEVVANIKSRDEILSLFFIILSLFLYAKWFEKENWKILIASGVAFFAALLSKEGAITALAVFPLIGWTFFQKSFSNSLKNSAWALIAVALFFLLRGLVLRGLTEPAISMMDNPIVEAHGMVLIGTSLNILAKYLFLLVVPVKLVCDYSYNVIPLQSFGSTGSLIGLALYSIMAFYAIYAITKRRVTGFFVASFFFSISLYSQIPKVLGTMMAERLLYAPSMWFVLALAGITTVLAKTNDDVLPKNGRRRLSGFQRYFLIATACVAFLFSIKTITRNNDWASNSKLYQADVAKVPNSVRLNDGSAEVLYKSAIDTSLSETEKNRDLDLSEKYSEQSLKIKPGVSAYNNLGNVNFSRRNFAEAVSYYQKALEEVKDFDISKRNIINVFIVWGKEEGEKNNNPERARQLLQQALQYDENNSDVWQLIGISYGVQSNYAEALKAFEKAYSLAPTSEAIKHDLKT
ncbi:MAG: tetratricopeptide repeat protein, partial [Saprospiraceae bacterium]